MEHIVRFMIRRMIQLKPTPRGSPVMRVSLGWVWSSKCESKKMNCGNDSCLEEVSLH
jgi:hypothetical protein